MLYLLCPQPQGSGIKRCFYPPVRPSVRSFVCLSVCLFVCPSVCPSVAYIANNSRPQRPSVPKFGMWVPHLRCDSHTSFKVKRSKVGVRGGRGHTVSAEPGGHTACFMHIFFFNYYPRLFGPYYRACRPTCVLCVLECVCVLRVDRCVCVS